MKTELVHSYRGDVFTSSKIVAEKISGSKDQHRNLVKTIETLIEKANFGSRADANVFTHNSGSVFRKSTFKNKQGRIYPMFEMNEQAYMYLVMQLGQYKNALQIQGLFISAFTMMKQALQNQNNNVFIETRNQGKLARKNETDAIKLLTEHAELERGKPMSYPLYSTYTQMTNKNIRFLMDTKEGKPLRDLATIEQLGFISVIDGRVERCIMDGLERKLPYKEIYKYAKDEVEKLVDALGFKKIETKPSGV